MRDGGLSYAIELELPGGQRLPGFASRDQPFEVQVQLDEGEAEEKAALRRVNGLRSSTRVSGEWVNFGKSTTQIPASRHSERGPAFSLFRVPDRLPRRNGWK